MYVQQCCWMLQPKTKPRHRQFQNSLQILAPNLPKPAPGAGLLGDARLVGSSESAAAALDCIVQRRSPTRVPTHSRVTLRAVRFYRDV